MNNDTKIRIVACSVYKKELELLQESGKLDYEIEYLDSMMHMYPKKLEQLLNKAIKESKKGKIVLLYGDCHARMLDQLNENVIKVRGINCCDAILGNERYRELRKKGAFVLIHEWMIRWEEVFKKELGLKTKELARQFMREMHKEIVFLDTGVDDIPVETIKEISDYTGLPFSIEKCSLNEFENAVLTAIKEAKNE
ncbi:MAG: DUF1638 domain-containing protein [Chloroflexia bacterium]|nr:DUF1638 domain-containing protein [Chloroflexia bacterium]